MSESRFKGVADSYGEPLTKIGRSDLLAMIQSLKEQLLVASSKLKRDILPGWTCSFKDCGVFNGIVKELRFECRACGRSLSASLEERGSSPRD